jgi:hypothetical protein
MVFVGPQAEKRKDSRKMPDQIDNNDIAFSMQERDQGFST